MNLTNLDLFTIVMLGYLLILTPLLGRLEMARLRRSVANGVPSARLRVYRRGLLIEWGLTSAFIAAWMIIGRTPAEIGLRFTMNGWQGVAVASSVTATLLLAVYFYRASRNPQSLADVRSQLGPLVLIAPHTTAELRSFTWLSITAGICEELLYRGLLMTSLAALTGLWPAVLLSSIVFGIGHAYQGATGVLRTGLVGLALALVVVFTGSLLTAMLMHAVLDIAQGRLIWAAINDGDTGLPGEEGPAPSSEWKKGSGPCGAGAL